MKSPGLLVTGHRTEDAGEMIKTRLHFNFSTPGQTKEGACDNGNHKQY